MTIWEPNLEARTGPVYRTLADAIAEAVHSGALSTGDRLPTQRALARRLGIAVTTVTRAYTEAERRGLVSGEVGRGTFVRGPAPVAPDDEDGVVDLRTNTLMPDPLVPELRASGGEIVAGADASVFGYSPHRGFETHRVALSAWLESLTGLPADPDRLLVTAGAQHAMAVVFSTLMEPGDTLMVEELTYVGMRSLAHLLRIRLEPLPMDDQGIRPDALLRACRTRSGRALYCIPTFQNPTAVTMSAERRREVGGIAAEHGVPVVEDDSYGFLEPERTPLVADCAEGYYLTGTSKSLLPGLRVGMLRAPHHMVERLEATLGSTVYQAPTPMAEVVARWSRDGTADRVLEWKRREVRERQAIMSEALPAELYTSTPSSPHGWLALPEPWTVGDFVARAAMRGVEVTPAHQFAVSRDAPHAVRICVGPVRHRSQIETAANTLSAMLSEPPDAGRVVA